MSKPQLAIILDDEALRTRNAQHAINLLRSLTSAPKPILSNFFGTIDFHFIRYGLSQEVALTDMEARGCVRDIAHAVPEILFFLPLDRIVPFVYLCTSLNVVERVGDSVAAVQVDMADLKFQMIPLFIGLQKAMNKVEFPPGVFVRHSNHILDRFDVPSGQRGGFLP